MARVVGERVKNRGGSTARCGGRCRCYCRRNYGTQRVSWLQRTADSRAIVSRCNAVFRVTPFVRQVEKSQRIDIADIASRARDAALRRLLRERKLRVSPTRIRETDVPRNRGTTFNLALAEDTLRRIHLSIFTIREAREL